MENVDRSFQDQPGGKDDSKKIKMKSVLASSKLGVARCSNRDKVVGTCAGLGPRLDKSLQSSNMTQVSKLHQVPVMKTKLKKTERAGPDAKSSSDYNVSSKTPITEAADPGAKSSSVNKSRSKNSITEGARPGVKSSSVYNSRSKKSLTEGAGPGAKSSSANNSRSKNSLTQGAGPEAKSSSVYNSRSKNSLTEGAGPGAKSSSVYNLRSKNPLTEAAGPGAKSSSVYNLRSKNPLTEAAGPGAKSSSVYNLRSKNPLTEAAGPGAKRSSVYNSRSKNPITECAPSYNMRSKVQKTEDQNASINSRNRKPLKKDHSKDSTVAVQKTKILKSSSKPIKKIETPKPLTASPADLGRKKHPLTSQHELFSRQPVYHIRWEDDVEKGPLGYNCMLCNKDLSRAAEDDDDSEYDDDFQYDIDDEYDRNPPRLPSVDILSCGHAYHTDCLQKGTPKEQSSDPHCMLCYNTS